MSVIPYNGITPVVNQSAFIAPNAWLTGDVEVAAEASIFFGVTLRGDLMPIRIGKCSNLQEGVIVHTTHDHLPTIVEDYVTIGHGAILHGCTIKSNCIIGMGATILDGATIEKNCMVGANSLVTTKSEFPEGSLILGSPAKVKRPLTEKEIAGLRDSAERYIKVSRNYLEHFQGN